MSGKIIAVDDEQDFLDSIRRGLRTAGYKDVRLVNNPKEAAALIEGGETYDVALIDITMPEMNGMELLERVKYHSPDTECIMITAVNEADMAVRCLKKGAYDYLVKPVHKEDLILRISHAKERKRLLDIRDLGRVGKSPGPEHVEAFEEIVTASPKVLGLLKEAELHAMSDVPVLITGESGTGKELLARAIHKVSRRAGFPFMPVNMASVSAGLFDAEFFGHTKGAFTGADRERAGYLEHARHGTLFLDEIGTLPSELQGKLLRVLQEGEYMKLGSNRIQKSEVRFIAATNEPLDKMAARGTFRKDLYYRLRGAWIHLPPLRERLEDLPLLVDRFLREAQETSGVEGIEEKALAVLMEYDYPGNVRELRSIFQAAANLCRGGRIRAQLLPSYVFKPQSILSKQSPSLPSEPFLSLADVEKAHILKTYERTSKNKSETARILDIGLNTLRRKLDSYQVE